MDVVDTSDMSLGNAITSNVERIPGVTLDSLRAKAIFAVVAWILVMLILHVASGGHSIVLGLIGGGIGVLLVFWLVAETFKSEI